LKTANFSLNDCQDFMRFLTTFREEKHNGVSLPFFLIISIVVISIVFISIVFISIVFIDVIFSSPPSLQILRHLFPVLMMIFLSRKGCSIRNTFSM
jgi:hypothetical protein